MTVLADDLSVIEDNQVHVGPRAIDLRAPTAARLEADGAELVPVRHAERRRLALEAAPLTAPLAGWLVLEEGDELHAERVAPRDRPRVVTGQGYLVRPQGVALLDAVTVPVVRLRRPKDWNAMARVVALVREHIGDA